jgi:hypothetical protein
MDISLNKDGREFQWFRAFRQEESRVLKCT